MFKNILIGVIITMSHAHEYTNQLIHEDSPYLQQHAHNPLNWYPWGEKAFAKAKKEDKLIFLSIGYSTCHWCHVMERESFENKEIAKYMNEHYVNIKVDREELPHIDRYYQDVYMLLNKRSGGWPLSIIMTPDRKPFFAATYMPPDNRYGRPGLRGMAQYLYETYRDKKEDVYKSADSIVAALQNVSERKSRRVTENKDGKEVASAFISGVEQLYDAKHHGIGSEPKFPHATTLDTLLVIYRLTGDKKALKMALDTLEAMAKGGIYDQIEGGFYRYSVDAMWMIPHFEKMLYTNAELLETYTNAWKVTKNSLFKEVIEEIINNIDTRFAKEKLYFSASDADSDGEEGRYFLFDYKQTQQALLQAGFDKKETSEILDYFSISKSGNFEGMNNPYLSASQQPENLKKAKRVLLELRKTNSYPFIDYKIQTSWNALYINALLKVSAIEPHRKKDALASLDTLVEKLWVKGELYHQLVLPNPPKVKAYLEDYAFLTAALITAHQLTLDEKYIALAQELTNKAIAKFYKDGVWYMSDDDFRSEASAYDASYRSALAVMLDNMMMIANIFEDQKLFALAKEKLFEVSAEMFSSPQNFPTLVHTWLGYSYGWVLLKGKKKALFQNRMKIEDITYPFILQKSITESQFLACKIDRCFAFGKNIEDVIPQIK